MDVFSRNLKSKMEQGIIQNYQCSRRVPAISQLLFADDIIIFTNGNIKSVKNLKELIQDFCKASGQMINLEKSKFFVHNKVSTVHCRKIHQELRFQKGSLPTKYLGVPLYCGRTKAIHFDFLLDNIRRRISGWKTKLLSWGGKITIINSILNSIPIYALSVLHVPKKTILNIQRCFADFLWNQGDQKRMHWVAWDKVVKPLEEGGLNLKLLTEASYFWRSKLAWSFLQNKSIWSTFMNKKYNLASTSILDSKIWKNLVPLIYDLKPDCFWKVGRGKILFWSQKWWPLDINISQQPDLPDITIAEVWNDCRKKSAYLAALPEEIQNFASTVQISTSEDLLVWKGSDSGEFSSRQFRNQHTISAVERNAWWKKWWQPWIPTKISCFLWKCMHNAVPVDEAIQRAKIPMVSKCVCCLNSSQETLEHLMLRGEAARSVWSFLQGIFDDYGHSHSFVQTAAKWIRFSSTNSQFGCLKILAFAVAVWELWKWRNNCIHGQYEDHQVIKSRIIFHIQSLSSLIAPKIKASWVEEIAFSCLHIPCFKVKIKKGKWVTWVPNSRNFTVNIHALKRGHCFQGSYVIRNREGEVQRCIARQFERHIDFLQTLAEILREAIGTNCPIAEIQSDNQVFVDCLNGKRALPWRWDPQFRELRGLIESMELKHIEVERNFAAAMVASVDQGCLQNPQGVQEVRRALADDGRGLPRWSKAS